MNKRVSALIILMLLLGGFAFSNQTKPVQIKVLQDKGSSITLEFSLNGYQLEPVNIKGKTYTRVILNKEITFLKKGLPELPTVCRNVIIPDQGVMDYKIIDIQYETVKTAPIVPSKGNLYRNVDPAKVPYTFAQFYRTNTWWPERTIELSQPFILRDYRGISVRWNPFQFNPATRELRIARSVVIEIYRRGPGGENIIRKQKDGITPEFAGIYESCFLNFSPARYDSISERAGRMVIICADAYISNMQDFKTWKRMKGINTKLVPISSIGNSETAIRNFIRNEYNAGGLVWVLLVGDGDEVVPGTGTVGSANRKDADPVYAYTAGNDYYPDIFVSRFSSRSGNAVNIDKQANRSIHYEKTPRVGADWYHIGLGVASNQGNPPDYKRCDWLRDSLLLYYYTSVDSSYDSWGSSAIIKNKIEAGTGIINYIGHGSQFGWESGGKFNITDINNLNNPWMLPFVISVACLVGNFNSGDCYCEASVTAGTVEQPDGFLVHWGSTISQSWIPPCIGQEGAVNILTHNKKNTAGGIFYNGACYMIEHYGGGTEGVEMAQTWHIFGDASVQVRTNTPQSMTVNHPGVVNVGQSTFGVNVSGVEDALVGLYVDTLLIGNGYTNASGNVTITLNPAPSKPGTMYITVTAYNKIPYIDSVPIRTSSGPYVSLSSTVLSDSGGNGQVNPGERVELGCWAKNIGSAVAHSVYGLLRESDSYVTVSVDSAWYGDIGVGDSVRSGPDYRFRVAGDCPDGHAVRFALEFHDGNDSIWTSHPSFVVYAPVLGFVGVAVVNDNNSNGVLDPGEAADLVVTLRNTGGADARDVVSTLMTSSSYITVNDNSGRYGVISSGDSVSNDSDVYRVTASASTPYGAVVDFRLEVVSGVYCDTLGFRLTVGQLVPTDTGRYYAYYSGGPHLQSPVFSWVAIDSSQSQYAGVSLDLADDQTVQVNLPFSFVYYGRSYTKVSICANGWIAMGEETSTVPSNSGIPDSSGPAAMVAGLWTDLDPGNIGAASDVYYYNDAANHRFIVEWFRCEHYPSGSPEDFEIILYDPAHYPTPTGDGEIIVQYLRGMQKRDNTLGIENRSETIGIQYYYNGVYDTLAVRVVDSFAIKYTTYPPDEVDVAEGSDVSGVFCGVGLGSVYPNPGFGSFVISYGLVVDGDISLRVYDVSGRLVRTLCCGVVKPGYYRVVWDGLDDAGRMVGAGVYFVRFDAGDYQAVKKAVLLR